MTEETAAPTQGLKCLLERAAEWRRKGGDMWQQLTVLDAHPFGLESRMPSSTSFWESGGLPDEIHKRFCYVGEPGYTFTSVEATAAHLLDRLRAIEVRYLRVILGQVHPEDYHDLRPRHEIYYEVGFTTGEVLICGGCNDFSGGGKTGEANMDGMFAFLARLYGVEIETARVQISPAASGRRYLEECVNAAHPTS